jgi:hypothetical protein
MKYLALPFVIVGLSAVSVWANNSSNGENGIGIFILACIAFAVWCFNRVTETN